MTTGQLLDPFIAAADRALRAVFAPAKASRPLPTPSPTPRPDAMANLPHVGELSSETGINVFPGTNALPELTEAEREESAGLMRVNHAGEMAAQALYHGQALVARSATTRALLLKAAREETDHLAWCETRLRELNSQPSLLDPLWYAGSFFIGAATAVFGDRVSLGFVSETERQVEAHLDEHLARLPQADTRSRAILQAMRDDEIAHGANARGAGGIELPPPVREMMRHTARVMTQTARWI